MGSIALGAFVTLLVGILLMVALCGYWYAVSAAPKLRGVYRFTPAGLSPEHSLEVGLDVTTNVRPNELPGWLVLLLLLHEDDLFFTHHGINTREVLNRVRMYLRGHERLKGGSSITQQLVKYVFNPARKRRRAKRWIEKLYEIVSAFKTERYFSKEEILTLYLSSVRFGPFPVFGIAHASQTYFHKKPDQLTLHEALFLLAFIPRPVSLFSRVVCNRDPSQFPFHTSFIKCMDLNRLVALSCGWGALDSLGSLSFRDILNIAQGMRSYDPQQLSAEFELALEQRAIVEVAKLERVVEAVATTNDPDILRLVQLVRTLKP
jgi:hypothetical protein